MNELEAGGQIDVREYLHILGRRKPVIAVTVLLVTGLALIYSFVKAPTYSATATVLIPPQQATSALNIQNSQVPAANSLERTLADEQQFAKGDAVRQAATKTLGFKAKIGVGTSLTADVLTFTASSGHSSVAAAIANAYAHGYIVVRRTSLVEQYTEQVTALETSISQLQTRANALGSSDPQRAALQQSIAALTQTVEQTQAASQLVAQVGPTVVNAAIAPSAPASPKPVRNGILGLAIGLVIGVGLAYLFERLDDGINSREAAEKAADGMPVIALIPMVDSWRATHSHHIAIIEDPTSTVAEAYRTLRTSVQFLGIGKPIRVIGVTSSIPGEGKSTAVANLAVSFVRAGQRVIVVSCDLRRPRLHAFFGMSNRIGLTSVILGDAPLWDAVQDVEGEPMLRILPSGPVPPNPAEILSLDRVREVVEALSQNAEVVLIDCPPVLPVTDALLISRLVDGMLVLASTKSTSLRDLQRTYELLRQVQTPVLGTILNRVPLGGGFVYGYGYASYTDHQEGEISDGDSERAAGIGLSPGALRTSSLGDSEEETLRTGEPATPRDTQTISTATITEGHLGTRGSSSVSDKDRGTR